MDPLENRIFELGSRLLADAREEEKKLRQKHRWETELLQWCMKSEDLKARIFRFIDVYPSLPTPDAVVTHLQEYFPSSGERIPPVLRAGLALTRPRLLTKHAAALVTKQLYLRVASMFIGAANEEEAIRRFAEFDREGFNLSIDLLGEKTLSGKEADDYEKRYIGLVQKLRQMKEGVSKQNISVKLSALDPRFDPLDAEGTSRRVRTRLSRIFAAAGKEVFIHIDMEDYEVRDLTLRVIRDLIELDGISAPLGIVVQAYLRDAEKSLEETLVWLREARVPAVIRLVRGAYWDSEIMRAQELNWPVPVFMQKNATDAMFETLVRRILEESPRVRLAVASHNVRSLAYSLIMAEEKAAREEAFEVQLLYGMGASLAPALKRAGVRPRIYMPIGDPIAGMAYLVRRLLENVSSQSFIRYGIYDSARAEETLKAPSFAFIDGEAIQPGEVFQNAPLSQFHKRDARESFSASLDLVKKKLGIQLYPVIGGRLVKKGELLRSLSPLDGKTIVAIVTAAGVEEAASAVEEAARHFSSWAAAPAAERAKILRKSAQIMFERRYELSALEVFEVGKTWKEADADIAEAIDFLNYYAHHSEQLLIDTAAVSMAHEINFLRARPRGVCAVIAPWNFPIAILTGMSAAALAAGNPVIIKPAEQAMYCGWRVFEILREAGVPEGVLHYLPGRGEEAGRALVDHPKTAIAAFTGSKEAGLDILERVSKKNEDKKLVTKCIVEMGGKNAAIIDSSADLDQALPAVIHSAFSYAGQKCSALSRLVLLEDIYEAFLKRLVSALDSWKIGPADDPASHCGPVIDAEAYRRILGYVETGKKEGRLLYESRKPSLEGYYVPITVFDNLPAESRLLKEEIFGPVLCVIRAGTFNEALTIANKTDFALTGCVFSRTPSHIEKARRDYEAGNLYINRGQTGAVVGRQPFGGYRLSGGGTKAGSAAYLREFYIERTITENVSRHGFAPGADPETERSDKR